MSYVIRTTVQTDTALLPAVEQSAGQRFRGAPGLEWIADEDNMAPGRHAELMREGTSWVAADDADAPVGFIACERRDGALHICEFAVNEALHGRGVGRALLDRATDHARAHGMNAVTLTTFRDLAWNQPYYARRGFVTVSPVGDQPLALTLRDEVRFGLPGKRRCAMVLS
nr:GNAT family N-acetyltransferase [Sphingomonadaceae bacterium]